MKSRTKLLSLILWLTPAPIIPAHGQTPVEHVVAPGGKTVYYIVKMPGTDADGEPKFAIEEAKNENTSTRILLIPHPSEDPRQNLTGFSHLVLSPDSNTLYFETLAWATSHAIHAINLHTDKVSYITSGEIACVVLGGEYQGHLIVEQHRYFIQGGSHDDLYLYTPSGKEVGLAAQGTNAAKLCPTLGD
jgi:hypothetical protein